jgi:endonuclease/exonuclease/phosphatase (EEP) superfamily protein YafD
MRYFTIFLVVFSIVATVLPLIDSGEWWIRIFDFPRVQIMIISFLALALSYYHFKGPWKSRGLVIILVLAAFIYQLQEVLVYTPVWTTEAKNSSIDHPDKKFSLLVSNVRMDNVDKNSLIELIDTHHPDLVLITEPDQSWADALAVLDSDFPHSVKYPLDNTYGMMLFSKLPLSDSEIRFLVKEDIPSIFTKINLPSGEAFEFIGVHPEPPKPGTDTYERDTELLIIGKEIKEDPRPVMVAGDLNDVGWSGTSKLFRKYSNLVDPREGRGFYNTYSVFVPLMRYPLDHIFYSDDFGLTSFSKLEGIGSDHYPIFITLTFEPNNGSGDGEETDAEENAEVEEKIEKGK